MLSGCKDLTEYLSCYGEVLGERASRSLAPLHVPGRDPMIDGIATIKRAPFHAQSDRITAIAKAWRRQKTCWIIGECGVGKTLLGASAVHLASKGKGYLALIMCPDHLIKKWKEEIESTVPDATVHIFEDWKDVLAYAESATKPAGPEWLILGRDQSKGDPAWEHRFNIRLRPAGDTRIAQLRAKGYPWEDITVKVATCPRCGHVVADKDGHPIPVGDLKARRLTCEGMIVRHRKSGDDVEEVETACNEPLWQYVVARNKAEREARRSKLEREGRKMSNAPMRWAPYRILKAKMTRRIDYLILDEVHELKGGEDVAQANAAGALASAAKHILAMTGTLIGGYADHVFPIMMRLAPRSLIEQGIAWGDYTKFNARYGRIETTIHTRGGADRDDYGRDNTHSKGSSTKVTRTCKPGIMPQLFGEHLIDKCCFLTLEDVARDAAKAGLLPDLFEEVVPVTMDPELREAYEQVEKDYRGVIKDMLAAGNKTALGSMLSTLMGYPDMPYGFPTRTFEWSSFGSMNSVTISTPDLDATTIRGKDQAILDICLREHALGRKSWVYLQMTDIRDYGVRLAKVLGDAGLRVGYMRSSKPKRSERAEWIYANAPKCDVILSHPQLVETGMDLFAKNGNHNFPTLIFGQVGWKLFTLRQASRRSWRIGQTLPCKTVFVYYKNTMQEHAMEHMGKKLVAAEALEGKFSAEGLVAMAGEDDETIALAKALARKISTEADRTWSRNLGFSPVAPTSPVPQATSPVSFSNEELLALMAHLGVTA